MNAFTDPFLGGACLEDFIPVLADDLDVLLSKASVDEQALVEEYWPAKRQSPEPTWLRMPEPLDLGVFVFEFSPKLVTDLALVRQWKLRHGKKPNDGYTAPVVDLAFPHQTKLRAWSEQLIGGDGVLYLLPLPTQPSESFCSYVKRKLRPRKVQRITLHPRATLVADHRQHGWKYGRSALVVEVS